MSVMELLVGLVGLIPLDLPTPTPTAPGGAVYPQQSHGFAASVLGGFAGLGILVVAMILLNLRPRRVDRDLGN